MLPTYHLWTKKKTWNIMKGGEITHEFQSILPHNNVLWICFSSLFVLSSGRNFKQLIMSLFALYLPAHLKKSCSFFLILLKNKLAWYVRIQNILIFFVFLWFCFKTKSIHNHMRWYILYIWIVPNGWMIEEQLYFTSTKNDSVVLTRVWNFFKVFFLFVLNFFFFRSELLKKLSSQNFFLIKSEKRSHANLSFNLYLS